LRGKPKREKREGETTTNVAARAMTAKARPSRDSIFLSLFLLYVVI
jgi:hypothetical protein